MPLQELKNNKTPGIDRIQAENIKFSGEEATSRLFKLGGSPKNRKKSEDFDKATIVYQKK